MRLIWPQIAEVTMQRGTVKWFDNKKGYGFITPEDGSTDVFVHYTAIDNDGFRTLADGQAVEYEAMHSTKGFAATRVIPV